MKKVYCGYCDQNVDYVITSQEIKTKVLGVEVEVKVKEARCKICGEVVNVKQITKSNEIAVYDEYKKKVGLLTSGEIKEIRGKYNLSQTDFGKILGCGEKTIVRFENGGIQSKSMDKLIRLSAKRSNHNFLAGVEGVPYNAETIKDSDYNLVTKDIYHTKYLCETNMSKGWVKTNGKEQNAAC